MPTKWYGDSWKARVDDAARLAIDETTARAVPIAKGHHRWRNRTGFAEGSIQMRQAERTGRGWVGQFGSWNVRYFLQLEIRDKTLRRAADLEWPKLAERIRSRLK